MDSGERGDCRRSHIDGVERSRRRWVGRVAFCRKMGRGSPSWGRCAAICWCALRKAGRVTASCVSAKKHITLSRPGCRYIQRGIFSPREIPGGEGAPDRLGPSRGDWPQVATVWRTV